MADLVFTGEEPDGSPLNIDAMPVNKDLSIYRGDYVELFVTIKDSSGAPVDLTGYSAQAVLKETYESVGEASSFTCTIPTPTNGMVRVYMSTASSTALDKRNYIWDFQILNLNNDARTYLTGDVTVYPQVTR